MGREKKSLLCDPGSELRLGGREKKKGEDNKWDGKKREDFDGEGLPEASNNPLPS